MKSLRWRRKIISMEYFLFMVDSDNWYIAFLWDLSGRCIQKDFRLDRQFLLDFLGYPNSKHYSHFRCINIHWVVLDSYFQDKGRVDWSLLKTWSVVVDKSFFLKKSFDQFIVDLLTKLRGHFSNIFKDLNKFFHIYHQIR